jgi:hypothetical protein
MDYTRKKYADAPVGKFWLEIARLVIEGMATAGEKAFLVHPKGPILTPMNRLYGGPLA